MPIDSRHGKLCTDAQTCHVFACFPITAHAPFSSEFALPLPNLLPAQTYRLKTKDKVTPTGITTDLTGKKKFKEYHE